MPASDAETFAHAPAGRDPTAAAGSDGVGEAGDEGQEQEPEEGARSLQLVAALAGVAGSVGEEVGFYVCGITAAVHMQLRSEHDTGDKGEDQGEGIEGDEQDRDGEAFHEGGEETIDEDEPAPDGDEDGVIDGGWVSRRGVGDDISDQCGNEEHPEELEDT